MQPNDAGVINKSKERLVGPRRALFVHAAVVLTAVVTVTMISLLLWRWMTTAEPVFLLVIGNKTVDGAYAEVRDLSGTVVKSAKLGKGNEFYASLPLSPGDYVLSVKLGDQILLRQNVRLIANAPRAVRVQLLDPQKQP